MTANNAQDKALLKQLNVLGLPTILFFNQQGEEQPAACNRVYGRGGFQRAFARSPTVNNTLNGTTVGNNGGENRATRRRTGTSPAIT